MQSTPDMHQDPAPSFSFEKHLLGTSNTIRRQKAYYISILSLLYQSTGISNAEIVQHTGLSQPSVAALIRELIGFGILQETGMGGSRGGRPPKLYSLNPDFQYVVGIDIDLNGLGFAVFNLHNDIVFRQEYVRKDLTNNEAYAAQIVSGVEQCLRHLNLSKNRILGIGISLPGLVDAGKGRSITHLNFPEEGIAAYLSKKLKIPVLIDNDCKMMALGEQRFGKAKNRNNVLCVNAGIGIGLGSIINGLVYRGSQGFAGEFGHIPVNPGRELCSCGKVGCLETQCSGAAIVKQVNHLLKAGSPSLLSDQWKKNGTITLNEVVAAVKSGDPLAIETLITAGDILGRGLATLIHLLDPDRIIIGGQLAHTGQHIIQPIEMALNKYLMTQYLRRADVMCSDLLDDAALHGTMAHVMSSVLAAVTNPKKEVI